MRELCEIHSWNLKFHSGTLAQIAETIEQRLDAGKRGLHITGVNPEQIVRAQTNEQLAKAINDSDIVNIDGILAVVALRLRGFHVPERVASPDLMEWLLKLADRKKQRVYLLGAENYVIRKVVKVLSQKYPNLTICGWHDGFYKDESPIIEEISKLSPDYLFIALPSPNKETFIMRYKKHLNVGVFYGVGGAFDTIGGKCHRAPRLFQKIYAEWLWRIFQNPRQNGMRVLKFYPKFLSMIFSAPFPK